MPSISFDRAADGYDASRGYTPAVSDAIGAALLAAAGGRPGTQILEMGIGTGRISIPLLAQGADVTGVDISSRMLDRLRANLAARRTEHPTLPWGTLDLRSADMTALPFPAGTFDAVVAVHVFHLLSDWQQALDEALRVLRPGGALLLGQDRHPDAASGSIQSQWLAIVRDLGVSVEYIGAGYDNVRAALRARGLPMEESRVVAWTMRRAPRAELDYIVDRVWSRTWRVPDDLFATSVERLRAWAEQEYGDTLDRPREEPAEFLLTRAIKPAGRSRE